MRSWSSRTRSTLIAAGMLLFAVASASASDPQLTVIVPRGVQRGVETVVTFSGARLEDAEEILFYEPGVTVTKIEPVNANSFKATFQVAADCRPGEHTAQVRCKSGISDYRTFYVGVLPEVAEVEPNSEFDTPQAIELNVTVTGIVQNEDVDYYRLTAKKGQRISVEVEGMRLGTTLFDPYVAILDAKRFELASADDSPLLLQDCAAGVIAPEDGEYTIEVRSSSYQGNGNCHYRAHIGTFPRPMAVYPAGGKIGEQLEVNFIGDPAGDFRQTVQLPAERQENYGIFALTGTETAPSENAFRLFEHGNVLEVEPNNTIPEATPAQLPNAFNGIISEPGDVDGFRFEAKKGEVYEVECYARRVRSPLDAVMNLYNAQGGRITGNDDSRGPDSYFRFSVPADGEYVVTVTDHLGRGGADFVYRVEFGPLKPSLSLGIPRTRRYSQQRQQIYVARGNRFATLISAARVNFGGEIVLDPAGLPQGVTMVAQPMAANMNLMPVVFEAAADAPIAGKLMKFTGRHADASTGISGVFENRADFVVSAPGQSLYVWKDVSQLPVAVVEELPFTLEIVQPKVPLVRDGAMALKVVATRKEGFDAAINLQFPFRPPGIGAAAAVNIPQGQNEAVYPINANSGAALGKWPMYVLGSANVNGTALVSSQMAELEIAEPYLKLDIQRADVEQGKETEFVCKVEQLRPFEGAAKVELLGLPTKVVSTVPDITKETTELVFKVTTDPTSPAGLHKNIICRVTVTASDEPIEHSRAGVT
ncbi:MAG: peptidase, partial [Planctomycetaceae bacterium]|nr:peptidase [Planctomycetaceae bacterium]